MRLSLRIKSFFISKRKEQLKEALLFLACHESSNLKSEDFPIEDPLILLQLSKNLSDIQRIVPNLQIQLDLIAKKAIITGPQPNFSSELTKFTVQIALMKK